MIPECILQRYSKEFIVNITGIESSYQHHTITATDPLSPYTRTAAFGMRGKAYTSVLDAVEDMRETFKNAGMPFTDAMELQFLAEAYEAKALNSETFRKILCGDAAMYVLVTDKHYNWSANCKNVSDIAYPAKWRENNYVGQVLMALRHCINLNMLNER